MAGNEQLDPDSKRFQDQIEALVRDWAAGDDAEYRRRWKQLGNWAINRTSDTVKNDRLKRRLYEERDGLCEACGQAFKKGALTLHRVDTSFNFDKTRNYGYEYSNVQLLCHICHQSEERNRRELEGRARVTDLHAET